MTSFQPASVFFFEHHAKKDTHIMPTIRIDGKLYEGVEVNGLRYPVDAYAKTSKLLFRVVDATSCGEGQKFYSTPDAYFYLSTPKPRPEDDEDISEKLDVWRQKRALFQKTHEGWYDRVEEIKNNMDEFLKETKIDPRGYGIPGEKCSCIKKKLENLFFFTHSLFFIKF